MSKERLNLSDAREHVMAAVAMQLGKWPVEQVPLLQASGRVLDGSIVAPMDIPPQNVSAMDGYAFAFSSLQKGNRLLCVGSSFAGHPWPYQVNSGEAIHIATGAVLPDGCDSVALIEYCRQEGEYVFIGSCEHPAVNSPDSRYISDTPGLFFITQGAHVRRCGEVISRGSEIIPAKTRIDFRHIALLAALGIQQVEVSRRLRVAIFSSGDELQGREADNGQHDVNRPMLYELLRHQGVEIIDGGILGDDRALVRHALESIAGKVDLIITSGAVSMGDKDHIRHLLEEQSSVDFWHVSVKPGQAVLFGHWQQVPLLGLPGNPLAAFVIFILLGLPAIRHAQSETIDNPICNGILDSVAKGREGRVDVLFGVHHLDASGTLAVTPLAKQNSHRLDTLLQADCLILLDEQTSECAAGAIVPTVLFDDLYSASSSSSLGEG